LNKQREGVSTRTKPDGNLPQNRNITCLPWPDNSKNAPLHSDIYQVYTFRVGILANLCSALAGNQFPGQIPSNTSCAFSEGIPRSLFHICRILCVSLNPICMNRTQFSVQLSTLLAFTSICLCYGAYV